MFCIIPPQFLLVVRNVERAFRADGAFCGVLARHRERGKSDEGAEAVVVLGDDIIGRVGRVDFEPTGYYAVAVVQGESQGDEAGDGFRVYDCRGAAEADAEFVEFGINYARFEFFMPVGSQGL